jgi:mannitol/fructose-specific phosphotransferase system IIA component (Ntr-type)
MSVYAEKIKMLRTLKGLLKPSSVYITTAYSKDEIIRELCAKTAAAHRLDQIALRVAVLAREETSSTGLVNGLAIPHARISIKEPLLMCAVSQQGIDFDSLDGKLSHIFFLLVTPQIMPELQLQLLSDIAKLFSDDELSRQVRGNPEGFYQMIASKLQ